jgi:hypothetical protein
MAHTSSDRLLSVQALFLAEQEVIYLDAVQRQPPVYHLREYVCMNVDPPYTAHHI